MKTCMCITVLSTLLVLGTAMPTGSNTVASNVANAAVQNTVQQTRHQPQTQMPQQQQLQQQVQMPQQMSQVSQMMSPQMPVQFPYHMHQTMGGHHQYPGLLNQASSQMFSNRGQTLKSGGNSQMSSWLPMMLAMGDFNKKAAAMTMAMQPGQQNNPIPYMMMSGTDNILPLMAMRKMGSNPLLMMAVHGEMM